MEKDFLIAVAVLTTAFFLIKKIRGPLPPKPPEETKGGGQTEDGPTGPINEA